MIKTLSKHLGEFKRESLLTPVFMIGEVIFETLIPFIMGMIIDIISSDSPDMKLILIYGIIMLLLAGGGLWVGIMGGKTGAKASAGFARNLRRAMYRKIQSFSFANIDKLSSASLVTRMTTDVTNVQNAYQMILRMCTRAPASFLISMTFAFIIRARVAAIYLVAVIILGIGIALIIKNATKYFVQAFPKYDDLNEKVQENVTSIRVVKGFVREGFEESKFTKASMNIYKIFVKAEGMTTFMMPLMQLTVYGSMLLVCWTGAKLIVKEYGQVGGLTTGNLTSLLTYCMSILMSLMMLSIVFIMITMSEASAKRIVEVLEEEPTITNPENPVMEVKDGSIEFKNVIFRYNDKSEKPVLDNINISIRSGETIGIIGGTGSSKTSLVNMISRLYDVSQGEVLVGGVNVKDYDLTTLRNKVSVVLQKNVLFSGTILENLRWGDKNASIEEVKKACKLACADEFIDRMPEGYDTVISQGGTNVSGGQKQRLCIARALLKKPAVLILDDSTSAVDTATDAKIKKALREDIPKTTKIIIAQRISSVQDSDRIIVMDQGKVNGFGTHEELLKNNNIYREVYESQTKGRGDFDEVGGDK
ncbi:MAG: ABC transporter ATP-binding protein [Eubacterium sp.]|nr:ABC transporter ATP-binding protein [Eubacterium sp.]